MVLTYRRGKSITFPVLFVVVILISLHMYGIGVKQVAHLHFGPWDFAFLILLIPWLAMLALSSSIKITKHFAGLLLLVFLFTFWAAISALLSSLPFRALTMLVQQLRNLLMLIMIGTLFGDSINIRALNRATFWFGTVIASAAIFLYLHAWANYPEILTNPSLWRPNIVYILDRGGVLRLIGFAKDPNFYSLWIAPSLFSGVAMPLSLLDLLGISIIAISCILAMSRGFILGFVISTVFLMVMTIPLRKKRSEYIRRIVVAIFIIGSIAALAQILGINVLWSFSKRIELIEQTPRFRMWQYLIGELWKIWNPLWGTGLRGAQKALSGTYSHNSYFDVLFEMGLPGIALWLSILGYTSVIALVRIRNASWLPWIQTWLILLVMFGAFSLVYNPFSWLIMGILVAPSIKRESKKITLDHV